MTLRSYSSGFLTGRISIILSIAKGLSITRVEIVDYPVLDRLDLKGALNGLDHQLNGRAADAIIAVDDDVAEAREELAQSLLSCCRPHPRRT